MRKTFPATLSALALIATASGAQAAGFTLASPTIKPGSMLTDAQVFKGFGCEGKNVSPAIVTRSPFTTKCVTPAAFPGSNC